MAESEILCVNSYHSSDLPVGDNLEESYTLVEHVANMCQVHSGKTKACARLCGFSEDNH